MKCSKCDLLATFDSPDDFCDEHWARWLSFLDESLEHDITDGEKQALYAGAMDTIYRKQNCIFATIDATDAHLFFETLECASEKNILAGMLDKHKQILTLLL